MGSINAPIEIAIIGSGIGGLALAIGLLKQNVPCTVYEAAPKFDAVGAGIGLGPNALKAMALMDEDFARMYDEIKVGNTSPSRQHEQIEILGAEEGFGEKRGWKGGKQHGSKMVVSFTDGDVIEVDGVIGCDGIKGITRRMVLGERYPEEVKSKYAHTYVYRGIAPMEDAKRVCGMYAEDARWWMMKGKGWAMYPISRGTEANIVAFMQDTDEWKGEQAAREVEREEMEAEFVDFDKRLKGLLPVLQDC
ncbi:mannitol 1-phosphate dehydrogenase protein [Rutstroemia sp. NJR-2017a BBW]|nr:mannitol 1-phosphate dehydrogenase protein [Rutstroemia sp. NJR-2017a BBW]